MLFSVGSSELKNWPSVPVMNVTDSSSVRCKTSLAIIVANHLRFKTKAGDMLLFPAKISSTEMVG